MLAKQQLDGNTEIGRGECFLERKRTLKIPFRAESERR